MPARQMTVCFSGYRPEKLPWGYDECDPRCAQLKQRLRRAVCAACDDGFRHFICGMARGVDTYCAEIVLALRPQYPDLTLEAAIPCPSQCGGWTPEQQARWHAIVDRCDFETVVQDRYGPRLYAAPQPLHGGPRRPPYRRVRRSGRRHPPHGGIRPPFRPRGRLRGRGVAPKPSPLRAPPVRAAKQVPLGYTLGVCTAEGAPRGGG